MSICEILLGGGAFPYEGEGKAFSPCSVLLRGQKGRVGTLSERFSHLGASPPTPGAEQLQPLESRALQFLGPGGAPGWAVGLLRKNGAALVQQGEEGEDPHPKEQKGRRFLNLPPSSPETAEEVWKLLRAAVSLRGTEGASPSLGVLGGPFFPGCTSTPAL